MMKYFDSGKVTLSHTQIHTHTKTGFTENGTVVGQRDENILLRRPEHFTVRLC